jgi:hypothetical protein
VSICFGLARLMLTGLVPASAAHSAFKSARADLVEMKTITWLWPDRFAIGKLGLVAGLPDEGKGQILCDMAARVTRRLTALRRGQSAARQRHPPIGRR